MIEAAQGILLIAEPFLKDPNFMRGVIMLCRHNEEGTFGFVLNKLYEHGLDELIADLEGFPIPVFVGGPVQLDTIHYIHQYPELIPDSQAIVEGVYWGGDFETVKALIKSDALDLSKIKFFIGYSGWEVGQLDLEMMEKSWLTAPCTPTLVFNTPYTEIWKAGLRVLGGDYELMINYPIDPQLN